jgi:hypothetical protein
MFSFGKWNTPHPFCTQDVLILYPFAAGGRELEACDSPWGRDAKIKIKITIKIKRSFHVPIIPWVFAANGLLQI